MTRAESAQVEIIRVLCITSMMWVHVNPGFATPSIVNDGTFRWVGDILGATLGRVSVTTLSFISGYLFWTTGGIARPGGDVLRRLFFSIMLPTLVWSAAFILLALLKAGVTGSPSAAILAIGPSAADWVDALTGLTGPTANPSLFFIRDLVVSILLLRLAAPVFDRAPWLCVAAAGLLALTGTGAPLIFRPSILFFAACGLAAARAGVTLSSLSRPAVALGVGLPLTVLVVLVHHLVGPDRIHELPVDILRRAGIGLLFLGLSGSLQRLGAMPSLVAAGRHSFLAYLSHAIALGILWSIWQAAVGNENAHSYLAFYVLAPPLLFALAVRAGRVIDGWPALFQIMIRGKIFRGERLRAGDSQPA